jgi:UDP-glucose 4-epimerase
LDNVVDLIRCCLSHPAAINQTFLVSDGEDVSTTELLNKVAFALGKKSRLIPVSESLLRRVASILGREQLARRLCDNLQVDIAKTRQLLEWSPPLTIDEGLRRTVMESHEESV